MNTFTQQKIEEFEELFKKCDCKYACDCEFDRKHTIDNPIALLNAKHFIVSALQEARKETLDEVRKEIKTTIKLLGESRDYASALAVMFALEKQLTTPDKGE